MVPAGEARRGSPECGAGVVSPGPTGQWTWAHWNPAAIPIHHVFFLRWARLELDGPHGRSLGPAGAWGPHGPAVAR